jgi:Terminase large subunit, T4likevirus-type, N-terminal
VNILEALADDKVFAPLFKDHSTWSAWRAFLAALFALPMSEEELQTYRQCTARAEPPAKHNDEAWLVCGRRSGKSFMLALIAVFLSCFRDWRPFLGPGECATVMIIAADRRQARTIVRYVKGILQSVPMLAQTVENETAESISLTNRVVIEVHSCSFRAVRGYTVAAALLDEVAFWTTDEGGANPDHEVLNAIRPAMATIPGAMLLCTSSPYSRRGALWEAFQRCFGHPGGPLVWQAATRTMNPTVSQDFIDTELEKDPSSAAAEYLAQFRTDIEGYISREAVDAVTEWGVLERGPVSHHRYVAWVDPSGGSRDSFAVAVAHKDADLGVLDCVREVRPPFSPEGVVQEFSDLLKTYRITKVRGDRYAGEFPRELFARQGIKYELSDDPKSIIYVNFLPLINSGKVKLLGNKRLVSQLLNLERRTSRAGRDSIDHGPGAHDDVANAAAGALLAATAKLPKMRFGTIDFGRTGQVTWHDEEPPEHSRIRFVTITEQEDLRQRGLL